MRETNVKGGNGEEAEGSHIKQPFSLYIEKNIPMISWLPFAEHDFEYSSNDVNQRCGYLYRVIFVEDWRGRASKMINLIHLN